MPKEKLKPNLEVAIAFLGGRTKAAKELDVSTRTMYRWRRGLCQMPGEIAIKIEELTGGYVKRSHLRPDFWPPDDTE